MKHGLFRRLKHCTCTNCIFIFLSFLVLLSMLFRMDWVNVTWFEVENKQTFTTIMSTVSADPYMKHDFCYFHPWSPKEAFEQALLLDSIAWPETPNLLSSLPQITGLIQSSDPAHSTFTILPGRKGWEWHIGDELEVVIKINDFLGYPKEFGGDLLFARLHNPFLGAGVAGQVVDHLNGTYSAVFSLLWEGNAYVEVILVHSSEAISVLHRLTMEQHDRVVFQSFFRSGLVHEITTCNVCLRATEQPVCNYTDIHTGEPWFCYKPKTLSCNDRLFHRKGGYKHKIKINEEKLFQEGVNLKVYLSASGPSSISVLPKMTGQPLIKTNIVTSRPSGYYYLGAWQALGGTKVNQFNTPSAISQCLKRKKLHLYGDSTVRQWFEYLQEVLPDLRIYTPYHIKHPGPLMAMDDVNNILVTYRCHGPPIRFHVPTSEMRYIANELDHLTGGNNTVVVISVWSHFSSFPVEVYIRRLQNIRRAVVQLLSRAPGTLVAIRTANPKALTLNETLINSDWYSLQRDKVLRAVFKGVKVYLVDAWEMVMAHNLPHSLHPQPPIIKNMIDVLLSYICP